VLKLESQGFKYEKLDLNLDLENQENNNNNNNNMIIIYLFLNVKDVLLKMEELANIGFSTFISAPS
jgi:hypothetical protein